MNLTTEHLKRIYQFAKLQKIQLYLPYINQYAVEYDVTNTLRIAAFLAQIGHESGQLNYCQEIADGSAYEGRQDLGNLFKGDGKRYKGRGLIQITGRANYTDISFDFDVDFVRHPERLAEPEWAVRSAYWYWNRRKLNILADQKDFRKITKLINGGYNGYNDRVALYEKALKVLKSTT
ncbi:MAG: glycoside hydrolase family 19 protein [Clostridia bacterium]|nr:glycoside hydrolase family 19 protein [Clostridia bacterium]